MQMRPYYSIPFFPPVVRTRHSDYTCLLIALGVIGIHLVVIMFNSVHFSSTEKKIPRPQVVVKTVQLSPRLEPMVALPFHTPSIEIEIAPTPPMPAPAPTPPPVVISAPVIPSQPPPPLPPAVVAQQPKPTKPVEAPLPPPAPVKKAESKPAPPKPIPAPAPAKKPAAVAPVKKVESAPKPKPEIDKKAQEAEKARQEALAEATRIQQQKMAAAEESARQKQQQLLSKVQESLAKRSETKDKKSQIASLNLTDSQLPPQIHQLQIDSLPTLTGATLNSQAVNYQTSLLSRLQKELTLPDYGAIKVKLTLAKSGKVIKVEATSSSEKNRSYLEKTLPALHFSPFGLHFDGAEEYTFNLHFQNK